MNEEFVTVAEAAAMAGVTTQAVRLWGIQGKVPIYRRGSSGARGPYFLKLSELETWLTPVRVEPRNAAQASITERSAKCAT